MTPCQKNTTGTLMWTAESIWLSQTHMKNGQYNFSRLVIWFFSSVVEIPLRHSSLCNKNVSLLYREEMPTGYFTFRNIVE